MTSSPSDGNLLIEARSSLKRNRWAGWIISLSLHGLALWGVVRARYEVKILPVEKKIASVHLGPKIRVGLPDDYEKHLASLEDLERQDVVPWGRSKEATRPAGRPAFASTGRTRRTATGEEGTGSSGDRPSGFSLSYRPGSERTPTGGFDLQPAPPPMGGGSPTGSRASVSRLDLKPELFSGAGGTGGGGTGGGYALARSSTGDRVVYRGRWPSGTEAVDLSPWGRNVVETIQKNWNVPSAGGDIQKGKVGVTVVVEKDGRVKLIRLEHSSHAAALDRSALSAVGASLPFPPLPPEFGGQSLEVFFLFDCHEK